MKVEARTAKLSSGKNPDSLLTLTNNDKVGSTESPQPESVLKNVTFSTSKTHTEAATSALDVLNPVKLESQLGIAPLGETPFGLRPFGEIPMGETPFGLSPEGVAPLGNFTSMESSTNETESQDGLDGRYHVQVTAPDGSINGDYIVVDPVTGDVNGVRYEAAHDVDPLLVQRALLNFLSLDPRLRPAEEDIISTTEAQSSKSVNTTLGSSQVEDATSVVEISEPTEPPELLTIVA
ncbi:hypothetical protein FHG87_015805 [Trinorchestia longiramus]|nr:hypothetical protein FHG87_015805 [Trinorchestia longiramus]